MPRPGIGTWRIAIRRPAGYYAVAMIEVGWIRELNMRFDCRSLFAGLVALLITDSAVARIDEDARRKLADEVSRRQETIKKEIDALGEHGWAGQYYHGDGLGWNLSLDLAPEVWSDDSIARLSGYLRRRLRISFRKSRPPAIPMAGSKT